MQVLPRQRAGILHTSGLAHSGLCPEPRDFLGMARIKEPGRGIRGKAVVLHCPTARRNLLAAYRPVENNGRRDLQR